MFECMRCGYSTNRKYNLITHLKRKRICEAHILDVDRCELIKELTTLSNHNSKLSKMSIQHQQNVRKTSVISKQKNIDNLKTEKPYSCSYCNKSFKHRQGRFTHEKKHCKVRKKQEAVGTTNINIIEEQQNEIIKMQQIIQELKEEIKRLT